MIFSISFWQWSAEFLFNIVSVTGMYLLLGHGGDVFLETVFVIFAIFIMYALLPSFYLLADRKFRKTYQTNGFIKSLWSALKQDFD